MGISLDELTTLYSWDEKLLSTYHICAPCSAFTAAQRTLAVMRMSGGDIHRLEDSNTDQLIGFIHIYGDRKDMLGGFYLHPSYRDESTKTRLWGIINTAMGAASSRYCALYLKNSRAATWLKSKGAVPHTVLDDGGIMYRWERENN